MKLVVDTNIIISALIKDSVSRKTITHINAELYTVGFSKIELLKHRDEILKKVNINVDELNLIMEKIFNKLIVLNDSIIKTKMAEAKRIMGDIDQKDAPFIAAALVINSSIWSNDAHFLKQKEVKILQTKDLIDQI